MNPFRWPTWSRKTLRTTAFLWEGIEEATRNLAKNSGELYVVSGPIFYGANLEKINDRVMVPTFIFKAIYDPSKQARAAYLVPTTTRGAMPCSPSPKLRS